MGAGQNKPSWRRFALAVLAQTWATLKDIRDLHEWGILLIDALAVVGLILGGWRVSWSLALPISIAAIVIVSLARASYRVWLNEAQTAATAERRADDRVTAADARTEELRRQLSDAGTENLDLQRKLTEVEGVARDSHLHLTVHKSIERISNNTRLVLTCRNDGPRGLDDLAARIIDLSVWSEEGWKSIPVGEADRLKWEDGVRIPLPAGSPATMIPCSDNPPNVYIWRFRKGPGRDVGWGPPNKYAELHSYVSDHVLKPGGVRMEVAFEASGRRTQLECVCFGLANRSSGKQSRLSWVNPDAVPPTIPATFPFE